MSSVQNCQMGSQNLKDGVSGCLQWKSLAKLVVIGTCYCFRWLRQYLILGYNELEENLPDGFDDKKMVNMII